MEIEMELDLIVWFLNKFGRKRGYSKLSPEMYKEYIKLSEKEMRKKYKKWQEERKREEEK